MQNIENIIRNNIQSIGDESFPDSVVEWGIANLFCKGQYGFVEVVPKPNEVGYEKFIFVINVEGENSFNVASCYSWENNKWEILFTDSNERDEWKEVLGIA